MALITKSAHNVPTRSALSNSIFLLYYVIDCILYVYSHIWFPKIHKNMPTHIYVHTTHKKNSQTLLVPLN